MGVEIAFEDLGNVLAVVDLRMLALQALFQMKMGFIKCGSVGSFQDMISGIKM